MQKSVQRALIGFIVQGFSEVKAAAGRFYAS